jgi:hypothetical protein
MLTLQYDFRMQKQFAKMVIIRKKGMIVGYKHLINWRNFLYARSHDSSEHLIKHPQDLLWGFHYMFTHCCL